MAFTQRRLSGRIIGLLLVIGAYLVFTVPLLLQWTAPGNTSIADMIRIGTQRRTLYVMIKAGDPLDRAFLSGVKEGRDGEPDPCATTQLSSDDTRITVLSIDAPSSPGISAADYWEANSTPFCAQEDDPLRDSDLFDAICNVWDLGSLGPFNFGRHRKVG